MKNRPRKKRNVLRDTVLGNKMAAAYDAYKSVLEGVKNLKDIKFNKAYCEYYLYDMLEYLMISKIIDKSLPETDLCSCRFTGDYVAIFRSMLDWSEDKNIKKSAVEQDHVNLFLNAALSKKPNLISYRIISTIDKNCHKYDVKDLISLK